jgi:hypothetical protein
MVTESAPSSQFINDETKPAAVFATPDRVVTLRISALGLRSEVPRITLSDADSLNVLIRVRMYRGRRRSVTALKIRE